jgi:hypothetical protein
MPLPINLAEAHALILRQREELAAAEARASGAEAMIAHMKLVIAKLRREQYGQSSERGRKVFDQFELQLEELEADTSENAVAAEEKAAGAVVKSFARRRPVRAPLPAHLPRERVVIPAPTPHVDKQATVGLRGIRPRTVSVPGTSARSRSRLLFNLKGQPPIFSFITLGGPSLRGALDLLPPSFILKLPRKLICSNRLHILEKNSQNVRIPKGGRIDFTVTEQRTQCAGSPEDHDIALQLVTHLSTRTMGRDYLFSALKTASC